LVLLCPVPADRPISGLPLPSVIPSTLFEIAASFLDRQLVVVVLMPVAAGMGNLAVVVARTPAPVLGHDVICLRCKKVSNSADAVQLLPTPSLRVNWPLADPAHPAVPVTDALDVRPDPPVARSGLEARRC
jgi:hypothetical protein